MNQTKYLAIQDTLKKLFAMVLFILLARYLTIEEFGQYQQIILITGLFTSIFSAGLPVAISYFHGQSEKYRLKISVYKRFFITQIILSLIAVIVYISISSYLSTVMKNNYLHELSFLIILILFSNTTIELFKNLSTVTHKLRFFLLSTSTISFISVLVSISILIYTNDIFYLISSLAFFSLLTFLILVRKNLKFFFIKTKRKLINKKELNYVIAMGSVALVSIINVYIDQIMVSFMLPLSDYSNIRIGSFQIPFIGIITGSLLTVMVPIISRYYSESKYDNIITTWAQSIEKSTVLLVPIVIFCLVYANEIIINFFGDKYIGAIIIFQVYMFQWLRAVVIFGGIMGAIGLEKELFKNTAIITILNIILNYVMISIYGVIGAAITTTLLNYLALFLLVNKIDKKLPKKFYSYFPFKIYIISLLLSILFAFILKFIFVEYLDSIVSIILCALVFYLIVIIAQMKLFYNDISINRLRNLL